MNKNNMKKSKTNKCPHKYKKVCIEICKSNGIKNPTEENIYSAFMSFLM